MNTLCDACALRQCKDVAVEADRLRVITKYVKEKL